ncbi:MAG: hypothetical protein AAF889_03425 [Cyanobacteria bacterium P01_D01_bin.73]
MVHNFGLKLIPLAITLSGLVGSPAALAVDSGDADGGDAQEAAAEVSPVDASLDAPFSAQCEQVKDALATFDELQSELPDAPTPNSGTPQPTAELTDYLSASAGVFLQMSRALSQVKPSDTLLRSTVEEVTLLFSSMSSDIDQVASLVTLVESQQQQLQNSGAVDPNDPDSLQNALDPVSNISEIIVLYGRLTENQNKLETSLADLKRLCDIGDSMGE